jgi:hypothetical protein
MEMLNMSYFTPTGFVKVNGEWERAMKYWDREVFTRHGGAYDRGSADAWYGRPAAPHYFTGKTYQSTKIEAVDMSEEEIAAYMAGYNETPFAQKEW